MGRGTHGEVRDGPVDPLGVLGRVVVPSGSSETGRGTLREFWEGLSEPRLGPGRFVGSVGEVRVTR